MKYSLNLKLSENCLDSLGNISPYEVFCLFQEAANIHGEMLGVSFEEMKSKNLLWVVSRTHYKVYSCANPGDEVVVTTWPLSPTRLGYEREYVICDTKGNVIIKGSSNWALIYADTRRLAIVENLYNTDKLCEEQVFDQRIKRIRNFEGEKFNYTIVPDESMIDCNGHVNNTYYAQFAQNALVQLDGKIKAFQVDFHREVMCGQPLTMYTSSLESSALIKGENSDGELMFCAMAEYE